MAELLLDSVEIKGYRCFEHLTIEKLGRVNLIVGKNNVGKTALLEALWIYANQGYSQICYDSLKARDEFLFKNGDNVPPENHFAIKNLFFNRPSLKYKTTQAEFSIGELNAISGERKDIDDILFGKDVLYNLIKVEGFPPNQSWGHPTLQAVRGETVKDFDSIFISSAALNSQTLVKYWDIIERKVLDDLVNEPLQIIADNIVDVRFSSYDGSQNRIAIVRVKNVNERVPLKSLGEGATRLLGIVLALINCKDGMLLIDEIEIGFHYSILPDVWKLIFKTAKDLNVQVFATTHSKDCIEAFTQAAIDDEESE